jgi:hypothetical protein
VALPREGVLVEVALRGDGPLDVIVLDESPGLPPSPAAAALAGARRRPPCPGARAT